MMFPRKSLKFIVYVFALFMPFMGSSQTADEASAKQDADPEVETTVTELEPKAEKRKKINNSIQHHMLDAFDFHVFSDYKEGKHYGFPLPIILYDEGFHVFSSARFNHGESVAESNGKYYAINYDNAKIYRTDASGIITRDADGKIENVRPLNLSITKTVFVTLIISVLLIVLFRNMARSYAANGGMAKGVGRIFEPLVIFIRDEVAIPNIGEKHYKRYMGFLLSVFFFVLFLNLAGLTPLGINVTGNITVTFTLALIVFLITTFTANRNYWGHIFWMPGVPKPMRIILAPIELLGIFIKPFSLMIRLYANIFAGHIVIMSIIALMFIFKNWIGSSLSFGLAFALMFLEILVAFLQAYIFAMLAALYFGSAVEEHHHEEAH